MRRTWLLVLGFVVVVGLWGYIFYEKEFVAADERAYLIDGKMRIITRYQQQGIPLMFFGTGKLYDKGGTLCLEGNKLNDLFQVDAKEVTDKDGAKRIVYSFPRRRDNDFNKEVGIGDVIYIADGEIVQAEPIIDSREKK